MTTRRAFFSGGRPPASGTPAGSRRRARVAIGTVVGLTAVVAACGTSAKSVNSATSTTPATEPAASGAVVLAAYTQTVNAKSAEMSINESATVAVAGKSTRHVNASGNGTVDFATQDAQFTFSNSTTGTLFMRFINPVLYLELPADERFQLPAGKSWVEVNLNTVSEAKLGASLAQLSSSSQESTQTLSYLQAVSSNGITTVGPATIRGVATTEYKTIVDLSKEADQKSAVTRAALKALYAEVHASIEPVQVWLDAQGRVRQISYQLKESTSASTASSAGTTTPATSELVTSTVDYFDFGVPINVSAPPANQVDNVTGQVVSAATSTTATG